MVLRTPPSATKKLTCALIAVACAVTALLVVLFPETTVSRADDSTALDRQLSSVLAAQGFTGRIESTLEQRLGRPLNPQLANIGRLLWFDTITGLNNDNTCAGCHSPTNGFGDSQPIAIGIENNGIVGPDRQGPRNQRRAPMVINTAFFPNLMWNSRFSSVSGNPFDNSQGYLFPPPEGTSLSYEPQLLVAQAFIPPTERTEVVGFTFPGDNYAIRAEVMRRLNAVPGYRELFGEVYSSVRTGGLITYDMFASAIAEFEFSLTYADAPVDQFARGDPTAMTAQEKDGALLFFGKAGCVECHAVAGQSNEMFSDFKDHDIGVPQLVPKVSNVTFDGPAANQDFGQEDFTANPADRYKFRTAPLRNIILNAAYMHDGAFTSLRAAIVHHLNVVESARRYSPSDQNLPSDLTGPMAPLAPILAGLDPKLRTPTHLTDEEIDDLVAFVGYGLLDPRARPDQLKKLVPSSVPSGRPVLVFQFSLNGPSTH